MKPSTLRTLQAADKAVQRLLEACPKDGPLYRQQPKAVAQVNRTAKWLRNALAKLFQELNTPASQEGPS